MGNCAVKFLPTSLTIKVSLQGFRIPESSVHDIVNGQSGLTGIIINMAQLFGFPS
jgi:hypothetical protein